MTKFKGFTLAEVLITLGIIGVVAAMTMPTLINSTQGAQYRTAFKKSLTVLSQAVVMNIALNDYDLSQVVGGTNTTAAEADDPATPADEEKPGTTLGGTQSLYDLFSNRLNVVRTAGGADFEANANSADNYTIIADNATDKTDRTAFKTAHCATGCTNDYPDLAVGDTWKEDATLLFMNDGITFIFDNTQANCAEANQGLGQAADNYCFAFIDVNGQKAPNRVVQCDGSGTTTTIENSGTDNATCTVSNPTDIYPIAMFNQSVIPASAAARAVLYNK